MSERIIKLAESVAREFSTRDPKEICLRLGITVLSAELPAAVSGFCMEIGGRQAVVISDRLEPPYDAACLAHELGHALLHKGVNAVFLSENTNLVVGKFEREADLFAVSLLVDDEDVRRSGKNAAALAAEIGMSPRAIEMWSEEKKLFYNQQAEV